MIKNIKINKDGRLVGVSLFLMLCFLLIIKLFVVYISQKNLFPMYHCIAYFIGDIFVFILVFLLVTIIFGTPKKMIRFVFNSIILLILILYYVDIFTIHYFMSRESIFSIFEVVKFGGSGFTGIAITWIVLFFLLWCLIFLYLQHGDKLSKFSKLFSTKTFTICLVLYIMGYIIYSFQYYKISSFVPQIKNIIFINAEIIKKLNNYSYSADFDDFKDYIQGDGRELNIILIFAESLSAIDSAFLGGNNNMPCFDEIQKHGISFPNFISHGERSISAHTAVFLGIPSFEGFFYNYTNLLKNLSETNIIEPLPEYLNKVGYKTIHISAASLDFLDERFLLEHYGFQKILGKEEFKNSKKYSCDAAPDGELFDKLLNEIHIQTGKYFISAPTATFHEPFDSPYGKSEKKALEYADEKLCEFYESLKEVGFFNSGILIIVGDHRKRTPAEVGEYDIFGPSWKYRSVATVVGSGIQAGTVNSNLIQHTDFYNSIKRLVGYGTISVDSVYNDIFTQKINRNRGILNGTFLISVDNSYDVVNDKTFKNFADGYNYFGGLNNLFLIENLKGSHFRS